MHLDALRSRGVEIQLLRPTEVVFDLRRPERLQCAALAFDRCLSLTESLTATSALEAQGVRCVNSHETVRRCGDKLATTLALERASVPTPRTAIALGPDSGVEAARRIGFPVVFKPVVGSWGRLLALARDEEEARAIVEHKLALPSLHHKVLYCQELIDKPGRDVRVWVVGGRAIAAIHRESAAWITNTAQGGRAVAAPLTEELAQVAQRAALAMGAEIAAVDLLECPRRGLLVNEVNHRCEFRNSVEPTGVDIPGCVADRLLQLLERPSAQEPAVCVEAQR